MNCAFKIFFLKLTRWQCEIVQSQWKAVWQQLSEINKELLPCDTEIPLQSMYLKELKTVVQTKTCAQMYTAPLISIAKR